MVDPIRVEVEVAGPPARAFSTFVEDLGSWYPAEYTWAGPVLTRIAIEPRLGGRCFEEGPDGFHLDWGRVIVYEPPARLAFSWHVGADRVPQPDPARASRVEVTFAAGGARTVVELTHDSFERHGATAAGYRDALAAPAGWPHILGRYATAANAGHGEDVS